MESRLQLIIVTLVLLLFPPFAGAVAPTQEEREEARRFMATKFQGVPEIIKPSLQVLANHNPVQLNGRNGNPLRIGDKQFTRGLYCHAFSRVVVRLPAPGRIFSASLGVDSNDQTRPGKGSVVFSVITRGKALFQSELIREGMPEKFIEVDLGGTKEFTLEVSDGGDDIGCDQADWADARVVLDNGQTLWLSDLLFSVDQVYGDGPFFSFTYGGTSSTELLGSWDLKQASRQLDDNRTEHTLTYTDPKTGLMVRCVGIEYRDFPAVEWILYFENTSKQDTPILENIFALDTQIVCTDAGDCFVHHARGSEASFSDYAAITDSLSVNSNLSISSHGWPTSWPGSPSGSPSVEALPMFNVEWRQQGWIAALGWTGPWIADFQREDENTVHLRARMDGIHLLLYPGEKIRSQRVLMLFWKGDRTHAHNLWRQLLLTYYSPQPGGKPFRGLLTDSSWGSWMTGEKHIEQINWWADHDLPMECYWMDAGWTDMSKGWAAH